MAKRKITYRKSSSRQLFWLCAVLALLLLLLWASQQKTSTYSKAYSPKTINTTLSGFGQAVQIIYVYATDNQIYTSPILPENILTFEAWVKGYTFTEESAIAHPIFWQGEDVFPAVNFVDLGRSGNRYSFNGESAAVSSAIWDTDLPTWLFVPAPIFSNNVWHHIALVKDGSLAKIFLDGTLIVSGSYNGPTDFSNAYRLYLGSQNSYDNFNGEIDEVRISNVARYSANFSPPISPFQSDAYTIGLYHFDGDVLDASGNGNNGTIVGDVTFVPSTVPRVKKGPSPLPHPTLRTYPK